MKSVNWILAAAIGAIICLIAAIILLITLVHEYYSYEDHISNQSGKYYLGQVLTPDYTHVDVLVVTDPIGLNNIFGKPNDSLPTSDYEIGDILYRHCAVANTYQSDYGLDIDSTGYTIWDKDRLVAKLPFDQNPTLDSVIYKDND